MQPVTAGMHFDFAMIAVCEVLLPDLVTSPVIWYVSNVIISDGEISSAIIMVFCSNN